MASSRISAARVAVADAFTTQSYRYPPGDENIAMTYVTLVDVTADQDYLTMGTGKMEVLGVEGVIFVKVVGGDETQSAVAEDAALVVLKELEDAIISDSTLGSVVFECRLANYTSNVLTQDGSLIARIDFTVSVESHL